MRTCTKCGEAKAEAEFDTRQDPGYPPRPRRQCRACVNDLKAQWKRKKQWERASERGPRLSKACTVCGEYKPLDQYAQLRLGHHARHARCKQCTNVAAAQYREANRKRINQRQLGRDPQINRGHRLGRYGITQDDYDRMHAEQLGVCAICKRVETRMLHGKVTPLAVDHCHGKGHVRGLLCDGCNRGIGFLKDDPDRLRRAAAYLERTAQ